MITTIIIDRGHATLDKDGKYATKGKQATLPNGKVVYEGKINEIYCLALAKEATKVGLNVVYTVNPLDPADPSLGERCRLANNNRKAKESIFVSVHNNAANGKAVGTEVFTNVGQSLSDKFAENIITEITSTFPKRVMRTDKTDGDLDKESPFYVLKHTYMPAVLIEYGFFDNPTEVDFLLNVENITKFAEATIEGIVDTIIDLYGIDAWNNRRTI